MLIKVKTASEVKSSEITSESAYLNRRQLLGGLAAGAGLALTGSSFLAHSALSEKTFQNLHRTAYGKGLEPAPWDTVTGYNNFYEFGTDKTDPKRYAHEMTIDPWSVTVEGDADKTGVFQLEDLLAGVTMEERIYRLRCVEAWSMVIPWVGFPLSSLLKKFQPQSKAKYVIFETLHRPEEMRGTRTYFSSIEWPYVEALRIDEAMHPLTILAVGVYGKPLPNQNGAPLRLVVPWKYGFKSIKSIVKIRFSDTPILTSWQKAAPNEYGFYSNVNPQVDHPRWSQRSERRLPNSLFSPNRIKTEMFNGYAEEVAGLYSGMDLKKNF